MHEVPRMTLGISCASTNTFGMLDIRRLVASGAAP
jgi:hypothetical protein